MNLLRPLLRRSRLTQQEVLLFRATHFSTAQLSTREPTSSDLASVHRSNASKVYFDDASGDFKGDLKSPATSESSRGFNRPDVKNEKMICGNGVVLLDDGGEILKEMAKAIDSARESVMMEMYWVASDKTGLEQFVMCSCFIVSFTLYYAMVDF